MPPKDPVSPSYRWYGPMTCVSFGHRSRAASWLCASVMPASGHRIINTWSDINPCHSHLRERGRCERGVWPSRRISVGCRITLGEHFRADPMMYASPGHETEELLRSYPADGCVLLGVATKPRPALLMGAISANLPAVLFPRSVLGQLRARYLAAARRLQVLGERRAGNIDQQAWMEIEEGIARSAGTCMTMGTALR